MTLSRADATVIVTDLYGAVLGRLPDAFGPDTLVPLLEAGYDPALVRAGLAYSAEAASIINVFYLSELGRAPDPAGLQQFLTGLANGLSLSDERASIASSPEGLAAVAAVYAHTLGRVADPSGLANYDGAVGQGLTLGQMQAQLAASPEATARLTYAYQLSFGTAPSSATLDALRGELTLGKSFSQTIQVDDRQSRTSGIFFNNDGYTVQAQYSLTGSARFISLYGDSNKLYTGSPTVIPVASTVASAFGPGPDTITLDLRSIGPAPVTFLLTLDGRVLGGASISTVAQTVPSGPSTVDEMTFTGDFGATFHDLHLAISGDPAAQGIGITLGRFDGNNFLLGGTNTGGVGSFSVYPHPGPQPAISVIAPGY